MLSWLLVVRWIFVWTNWILKLSQISFTILFWNWKFTIYAYIPQKLSHFLSLSVELFSYYNKQYLNGKIISAPWFINKYSNNGHYLKYSRHFCFSLNFEKKNQTNEQTIFNWVFIYFFSSLSINIYSICIRFFSFFLLKLTLCGVVNSVFSTYFLFRLMEILRELDWWLFTSKGTCWMIMLQRCKNNLYLLVVVRECAHLLFDSNTTKPIE